MCCHLSLWCFLFCQSSVICLSFVYIWATQCDVCDVFPLCRGLWVRMARKACWLAYCKIRLYIVKHCGTFVILHFTYYAHTKPFSGILNSEVVWVLQRRASHEVDTLSRMVNWVRSLGNMSVKWVELKGRTDGCRIITWLQCETAGVKFGWIYSAV